MAEPHIVTGPGLIRKSAYDAADRAIAVLIKNHGARAHFAISSVAFRNFVAAIVEAVKQENEAPHA